MSTPSRKRQRGNPLLLFLLPTSLLLIIFLASYSSLSQFLLPFTAKLNPTKTLAAVPPQCHPRTESPAGDRFLWYAPHSGFSNQLAELRNALLFAAILNRTLIVPPVLDHHAVTLGSCPKFRVSSPSELRATVWDHVMELARSRRYVSMGDIVDLSILESSMVRTVDFRVFASMWCGLNMGNTCYGGLCCSSVSRIGSSTSDFDQCRSLLSGLHGNIDRCIYAVQEDCRTTVWTYKQGEDGILDTFQPDKEFQKKKKISFVRKRRDLYNTYGPGSEAETATVLAFGSLFTAPYRGSQLYVDIHESPRDSRIQSLIQKTEFLPFVTEIIHAGKEFAKNTIKEPFLCAQLRLLDGQFKNHWKTTFSALKQKVQSLQLEFKGPIHIFIMTDLPVTNWTGTYLSDLAKDEISYKLYALHETDELIGRTAKRVMEAEHGLRFGFADYGGKSKKGACEPVLLPDILLYIEETVCSCASLGFVGTVGSTIAESIESMRKHNICKL